MVAAVAARVLGDRSLAVTAVSPALAAGELEGARSVARAVGIAHEIVRTDELAREGYRANAPDRCYHCKTELYSTLSLVAQTRDLDVVFSGANADDLGDWRPGLRAASEHAVRHPLVETGLDKGAVRELAHELGIPSADKPASPCLASRIPYGTPVEPSVLAQIDDAERALRSLGYHVCRVRHFGETARVEIVAEHLPRALSPVGRMKVERAVLGVGYSKVEIDPEPFRSGSMNRLGRPLPIARTS